MGYSPWACKESNMTEQLTHAHTHTHTHFLQHRILLSCHLPCSFPSGLVSILSFNIQNTARKPSSKVWFELLQFSLVAQLCLSLCNPMDSNKPGFPVHHQLPELYQTHVHQVSDAIQPSLLLLSPSPLVFNFPSIRVFSNELALCIR